ncbi:hypothetical protein KW797_02620 [Candidatus Parcubacteria bacterium]|nr:hypothetical protein [Candidatus Parcubacteria bacterium]
MPQRRSLREPSRLRGRRQAAFAKSAFFFIVLCGGVICAFVFFIREPFVRVQAVTVMGEEALSESEVQAMASTTLEGYYFSVLPRDSIFFYPRAALERELSSRFTRVHDVEVSRQSLRSLSITLHERAPVYLWCGAEKEIVTTACFFLDEEGYVFERAPTFSGSILTRFYGPLEKGTEAVSDEAIGKYFLPSGNFVLLGDFVRKVAMLSLAPSYLVKKEDGDMELFLKEGGKVALSLKEDMEKMFSNLESALLADPLKSDMEKRRTALDYIDLRFGNKVFFKFR